MNGQQISRYDWTPRETRAVEAMAATVMSKDPATKRIIAPGIASDKVRQAARRAAVEAGKKRYREKGTLASRCRAVLQQHGDMTAREVADVLGDVTAQQTSNAMSRMRQVGDGVIVVGKDGYLNVWRWIGTEQEAAK